MKEMTVAMAEGRGGRINQLFVLGASEESGGGPVPLGRASTDYGDL